MTPEEARELDRLLMADAPVWVSQRGPQTQAFESLADELFYGGQAGGGKTDLGIGLALTQHHNSLILRREHKQLKAIVDRIAAIRGGRDGYNSQDGRWKLGGQRSIDIGGCQHLEDRENYQGQPHDLIVFDEGPQFLEAQYQFIIGWNRPASSAPRSQRCRVVMVGNPPTDAEGEWVIRRFAAWLDDTHPNPAMPGELRWYATLPDGAEVERPNGEPFEHSGETITPRSRTFIPSGIDDNIFLSRTSYKAVLQALPEPLRSQMLHGNFGAGRDDDPWQVIPTGWVKAAQDRWTPDRPRGVSMSALGVDVAMGGRDQTILQARYGDWFDQPQVHPGKSTPDSPTSAGLVVAALRDGAAAQIDNIGPGGEVYGHLNALGVNVLAMNGAKPSFATDKSGKLNFFNKRAEWYWKMREALDPAGDYPLALPPNSTLRADLCAARWKLTPRGIQVEDKKEIIKRIGRSPDYGDAAVYALCPDGQRRMVKGNRPTQSNRSPRSPHQRRR
jgi:hypothetical protein